MKKFTTLLFALLLTIPAMAANLAANSYIYFVKPDSWTQAKTQFMIGHDSWSQGYEMSKLTIQIYMYGSLFNGMDITHGLSSIQNLFGEEQEKI